jgi:hypothetical protein
MKLPTGKGFYTWQIPRCGAPQEIAAQARAAGLNHVFIKIANGTASYGIINGVDLAKQLADELKALLIEPYGWQYVYNYSPVVEAQKAIQRIDETGVIGFAIDAESECNNKPDQARSYSATLRQGMGNDYAIGLASYRFPSLHLELPWAIFREFCNFDMPQVYWVGAHDPGAQLRQSYNEFAAMGRKLPYIGTGFAYRYEKEPYYMPTLAEINEFMTMAGDLDVAFNFWEWYDATHILPPEIWQAISDWNFSPPAPPQYYCVRTTANSLYVRSSPNGLIKGYVPLGTRFQVIGEVIKNNYKWLQVGDASYIGASWTEVI